MKSGQKSVKITESDGKSPHKPLRYFDSLAPLEVNLFFIRSGRKVCTELMKFTIIVLFDHFFTTQRDLHFLLTNIAC